VVKNPDPRSANQARTLLRLLAALRPHWRRDRDLPARIRTLLAGEKSFGSRDRRLYRELIYTAVRYLPWIEPQLDSAPDLAVAALAWLAADTPATASFRAAILRVGPDLSAVGLAKEDVPGGPVWPPCPTDVAAREAELRRRFGAAEPMPSLLPDWFREHCPAAFTPTELNTLHTRAPLWLRLQIPGPAPVFTEFAERGRKLSPSPILPTALRLDSEIDVTKTAAYLDGAIEIQDLGSQLLLQLAGVEPGGHWLDACAGAGGKTLQLAALLGPAGRIDAHDIRPAALAELADRARRAGIAAKTATPGNLKFQISNLRSHTASIQVTPNPTGPYDAVLLDAPCSGSGTWRRAPHLKWTTTPGSIAADATRQLALLTQFSALVKPGGRLLYATCSLSQVENENVITAFLAAHADFTPAPLPGAAPNFHVLRENLAAPSSLTLLPSQYDTDGFFIAAMRRKS
jgi:16S rRNA (cytosine967-C5)-methyltransferase